VIVNRSVPRSAVVSVLAYDDVAEASEWVRRSSTADRLPIRGAAAQRSRFGWSPLDVLAVDRRRRSRVLGGTAIKID
jgi:hypothetical protein